MDSAEIPLVSVIIPCRGHARQLARCLRSLAGQDFGSYEVIVVDSLAEPDIATLCRAYPFVRLIQRAEGMLAGAARNLGASQARGELLAFLDADCIAEPGWVRAMALTLRSGARLVGGAVLHGRPWHPIAVIDNQLQFSNQAPGRPSGREALVPSCNIGMRRADFEAVGGFPATRQPTGEDGLFCKAIAAAWPGATLFVPDARVRHFGREGLRQFWVHQYRFGYSRAVLMLNLTPCQRRLGRHAAMMPLVALKRLSWLIGRAAAWHTVALLKMALFFPILLFGLAAWCVGFRAGCIHGDEEPTMNARPNAAG